MEWKFQHTKNSYAETLFTQCDGMSNWSFWEVYRVDEVMKIRLLWMGLESFQVSQENLLLFLALCLVRIQQVNSLHPGRGPSVELKQVVTPVYDFHLTQLWEIISVLNKSPIQSEESVIAALIDCKLTIILYVWFCYHWTGHFIFRCKYRHRSRQRVE